MESLRRIKLLRRLDIPIEEIKSIQKGALTLDDCLERHLVVLKRRAQNLEATVCFSNRLLNEHFSFISLPSEQILAEMDKMEEGGTSFVNVKSKDKKQRKRGALIGAFSFILFMVFIIGLVIWEALGIVKGTVVHTKNVGRDFMAAMKTLVGGELVGYTQMLNEARQIAIKRMVDEAEELGADAVINVRYGTSSVMSGAAEVIAYGTAVKYN